MSVSLKAAVGVLFICIQSVSCTIDLDDFLGSESIDLAGDWSITEEALGDVSGPCYVEGDELEYSITIEQTDNFVIVAWAEGESVIEVGLIGLISGHTVEINWALDDPDQQLEGEVVGDLEVSSDENSMEGNLWFSITGDNGTCSGTLHITAVRQQPLVADDSPQVTTLINVHDSSDAVVFMRPAGQPSITPIYLGSVAPGGTVVFPLPEGSWIVSYAHLDDGDSHFESLGMWNSFEEWEGRASSESGSTGTSIGAATSTSPGR